MLTGPDFTHLHMDTDSRNRRLYQWLAEMGLCVFPISTTDDSGKIDYLMVSVDLPLKISQGTAQPAVKSAVGDAMRPVEGVGDNVVLMAPEAT